MPELIEPVMVDLPQVGADKCPICEKASHPERTTKEKKEGKGCLKSIPANLGCSPIPPVPQVPNFTTAAHHLIPANQCLKPQKRLSDMCDTVGYDVNNPANGLSLPTCGQQVLNSYSNQAGKQVKYGELSEPEKRQVSFAVMKALNLQWHVGHHDWVLLDVETDQDQHAPNYNELVKSKLRELENDAQKEGDSICEPPDDSESGSALISEMNALSAEIKAAVTGWKKYFVSAWSYRYANQ